MGPARAAWIFVLAVAAAFAVTPARATAQRRPPVDLGATGVFGNELLIANSYQAIVVHAANRTRETLRGMLVATVRGGDRAPVQHELHLDLPARATRRALITVFVPESATVDIQYIVDDREWGKAVVSVAYGASQRSIVVMADPPRVRASVLDLDVTQIDPGGTPRTVRAAVGVVATETATGDPILPDRAAAYSTVGLVVATAPMLARLSTSQLRAITDWVRTGGRVLVLPRDESDFRDANLRALAGDLTRVRTEGAVEQRLVPPSERGWALRGPRVTPESFGACATLGFGRIYVATYDANSTAFVSAPEVRSLVYSILAEGTTRGVSGPLVPFGLYDERIDAGWSSSGPDFSTLRAALDPNESYRPALGIAALVLLLYIVVVGPLNFRFVGQRNRPILALVTTPIAALGCILVLLGVGYLGKGVRMRYRRVEVVEAVEGDTVGPARRYTALFLTRPATFDLRGPASGLLRPMSGSGGSVPPVSLQDRDPHVLRDVRGGLWETMFMREDRLADLGGRIQLDRDGQRLVAVRNGTRHRIRGAIVVDGVGGVYRVGPVPAGGRALIAQAPSIILDMSTPFYSGDRRLRDLGASLGLDPEQDELLRGLCMITGSLVTPPMPTLVAAIDPSDGDEGHGVIADMFGEETDIRLLRVVPAVPPAPIGSVPSVVAMPPPIGLTPDSQPTGLPPLPGAEGDAGTDSGGGAGP